MEGLSPISPCVFLNSLLKLVCWEIGFIWAQMVVASFMAIFLAPSQPRVYIDVAFYVFLSNYI